MALASNHQIHHSRVIDLCVRCPSISLGIQNPKIRMTMRTSYLCHARNARQGSSLFVLHISSTIQVVCAYNIITVFNLTQNYYVLVQYSATLHSSTLLQYSGSPVAYAGAILHHVDMAASFANLWSKHPLDGRRNVREAPLITKEAGE
jgi:hypothetical protein